VDVDAYVLDRGDLALELVCAGVDDIDLLLRKRPPARSRTCPSQSMFRNPTSLSREIKTSRWDRLAFLRCLPSTV
jgi:hypothetical protein